MVKELTEKRYPGSISWIIPVDQTKIRIHDQRLRTRCQIVAGIQNPTLPTKLHKIVANGTRWRREFRQMEHPTKISRHCSIRRLLPMLMAIPQQGRHDCQRGEHNENLCDEKR